MIKPFEFSAHAELVEALIRFEQQPVKDQQDIEYLLEAKRLSRKSKNR
jgi:hypothetical protein